ncbi:MAG: hypothetical protein E7L17_13375 [Clostridium sp.]|uniref:hypothetical protein n=1 Tax=Clostridium sp. TaxID=1506 RepID=UPI00290CAADB|nr:hypothetical protein [Clostridium sp.]MDU7339091.1 hypothetical protein [Clostridium sp.]
MKRFIKRPKGRLLILAVAISLVVGAFTISEGSSTNVSYFGFPSSFITLHGHISEFPAGLAINPLQFAANVGIIWLILLFLSKTFRNLVWKIRKNIFRFFT